MGESEREECERNRRERYIMKGEIEETGDKIT